MDAPKVESDRSSSTTTKDDTRLLIIGDSPAASYDWADVPQRLSSIYLYDRILVIPGPNSESQQIALCEHLKAELSLAPRTNIQIIWFLNSNVATAIAPVLNLGKLASIIPVTPDRYTSLLPLPILHTTHAFADVPADAICIANAHIHRSRTIMTVAAMTADGRWLLTPALPADSVSHLRIRIASPRYFLVALLALFLPTLVFAMHEYKSLPMAEHKALRELAATKPVATLPMWQDVTNERWPAPARHMVIRLLKQYAAHLERPARFARDPLTPLRDEDLTTDNELMIFDAALLAGDTQSAYRILKTISFDNDTRALWAHHITETVWQRAVESLHEDDFDTASYYVPLYINSMRVIKAGATSIPELEPHRIQTLAHIAAHELKSNDIKSLCSGNGVADSFGRLLGRNWGEQLPKISENLKRRRAANDARQCTSADRARPQRYDRLAALEAYYGPDLPPVLSTPPNADCALTPLECSFLNLRSHLRAGRLTIRDADRFLSTCSYLSDDLLADILMDEHKPPMVVPASVLDNVLSCPDADDYRGVIATTLAEMPCERTLWDQQKYRTTIVQQKARACHAQ
jgi:hypothetical protein